MVRIADQECILHALAEGRDPCVVHLGALRIDGGGDSRQQSRAVVAADMQNGSCIVRIPGEVNIRSSGKMP